MAAYWETSAGRQKRRREVLVRFDVGALWLDHDDVKFLKRPDPKEVPQSLWDKIRGEKLKGDGSLKKTLVIVRPAKVSLLLMYLSCVLSFSDC